MSYVSGLDSKRRSSAAPARCLLSPASIGPLCWAERTSWHAEASHLGSAISRRTLFNQLVVHAGCESRQTRPLASPRTCLFDGACHTCPARIQAKPVVGQPDDEHERKVTRR
jgi:hypothetical protein